MHVLSCFMRTKTSEKESPSAKRESVATGSFFGAKNTKNHSVSRRTGERYIVLCSPVSAFNGEIGNDPFDGSSKQRITSSSDAFAIFSRYG